MAAHSPRNPAGEEERRTASEPARLPKEYIHRLNYTHTILAWGTLVCYVFWSSLQTDIHTDTTGATISTATHINFAKLSVITLCITLTVLTTVAAARRLRDPSLPTTFLLNQFHVSLFPSPQLASLLLSTLSLLAIVACNLLVAVTFFRKLRRERREGVEDGTVELSQIAHYVLNGVPNVTRLVSVASHAVLSVPVAQLVKWRLVARFRAANALPRNVLARRTVAPHGMLSLALVSAAGFALPGVVRVVADRQLGEGRTDLAAECATAVWLAAAHAAAHAASTAYLALAALALGDRLSARTLARPLLLSCSVHAFPLILSSAEAGQSVFALAGASDGSFAVKLAVHALPVLFAAVICRRQYAMLRNRPMTCLSAKID